MPVYQYACTECGDRLEVRQSFTDDALTVCPVCEGRLRKVLNAVGVVFKGSGFYRNDSRAAAQSAASGTTTGSPGAKAPADGGSGEASPKESGSKESGAKESGSNESGAKESGSKESGATSKNSGAKDSGAKAPVAAR